MTRFGFCPPLATRRYAILFSYIYMEFSKGRVFFDSQNKEHLLPVGERVHWRVSGYALIRRQHRVLLIMPKWSSYYELPGGGIQIGESIIDGLRRECLEETGYSIRVTSEQPFFVTEGKFFYGPGFYHSVCLFYEASLTSEDIVSGAVYSNTDEIQGLRWVSANDAIRLVRQRIHHRALRQSMTSGGLFHHGLGV
jgi:8-oxo-dGTP diphosphatase